MVQLFNLPETATREVSDRDQERILAEDEFVRIVRNRRLDTWQLVRRCGQDISFICLDGCYRVPGWFTIASFGGERYNVDAMLRKMRSIDTWQYAPSRQESVRKASKELIARGERQQQEADRAALDEASGAATERLMQVGKYYGPRGEVIA